MASTVLNAPNSVPRINGLDCVSYVGLKPSPNSNFLCVRTPANVCSPHLFVVRASDNRDAHMKKLGRSDAECEAAVMAGNVPEAPPVPPKPASPAGTSVVPLLPLSRCLRRNRMSPALRASFQETNLSPANFLYPLFIHEGEEDTPIGAMPGCYRLGWRHGLLEEVSKARDVGVNSVVLFPKVPDALKVIYTDVALDPYNSDGHDGIVREDGMQSSFYGPFREAVDSNPRFGDNKTYQMNPANYRKALIETCEDESEGADILLVKPGLPYLDIIRLLRDNSPLPIAAYQTKVWQFRIEA